MFFCRSLKANIANKKTEHVAAATTPESLKMNAAKTPTLQPIAAADSSWFKKADPPARLPNQYKEMDAAKDIPSNRLHRLVDNSIQLRAIFRWNMSTRAATFPPAIIFAVLPI